MTTPSPIVRYGLDDLSSLGVNLMSTSYNATVTNVSIVNDATFGNVADFQAAGTNGPGTIMLDDVPPCLTGTASRTVSHWVNINNVSRNDITFGYGTGFDTSGSYARMKAGSVFRFEDSGISNQFGGNPSSNAWHHFAVTYDGSTLNLYADMVLVKTATVTLTAVANEAFLGNGYGSGASTDGQIVDFRIYDVALTAAEITTLSSTGPEESVPFDIEMHINIASMSWSAIAGATYYKITSIDTSTGGSEVVLVDNLTGTEFVSYDLTSGSTYTFNLYTDLDLHTAITSSDSNLVPIIDSTSVASTLLFLGKDLTFLKSDTVSSMQPFLPDSFDTNDSLKARVTLSGSNQVRDLKFVDVGETISINGSPVILTPFIEAGSSGQTISLQLSDDFTTETVSYDETSDTVTLSGTEYSIGDILILDGKALSIAKLS